MNAHDIIIKPVLTEKSYEAIQNKTYVFIVAKKAGKTEIKQAVETIFSIIGQNAFPIVCCVYLLYDKRRSDDQHKQEIDDLRDTMTTALNNNTIALQKLIDKLG